MWYHECGTTTQAKERVLLTYMCSLSVIFTKSDCFMKNISKSIPNSLIGTHVKTISDIKEREKKKNMCHVVYGLGRVLLLYNITLFLFLLPTCSVHIQKKEKW